MSELYVARVIERRELRLPTQEQVVQKHLEVIKEGFSMVGLEPPSGASISDMAAQLVAWLKKQTVDEATAALNEGFLYEPEVAELLARDPLSVPRAKRMYVDWAWLGRQLLHLAHPKKVAAIPAVGVVIEAVTIHPDAGLPPVESFFGEFAVHLLSDACRAVKNDVIGRTFGEDLFKEELGGNGDDPIGVVPFYACVEQFELELTAAFRKRHAKAWWSKQADVKSIDAPSHNQPWGFARFDLLTFPAWVPGLEPGKSFASTAYGW